MSSSSTRRGISLYLPEFSNRPSAGLLRLRRGRDGSNSTPSRNWRYAIFRAHPGAQPCRSAVFSRYSAVFSELVVSRGGIYDRGAAKRGSSPTRQGGRRIWLDNLSLTVGLLPLPALHVFSHALEHY